MAERKLFKFYKSYYDVACELADKDRLAFYDENLYYLLEKCLLFKTEEECKKFADYCLEYFKK